MNTHPALAEGRVAVVTGAASGIGLAAARRFASMGLKVCLADLSQQALELAATEIVAASPGGKDAVLAVATDVSKLDDIHKLRDAAYSAFGEIAVLMNNAGTAPGGGPWEHIDRWRRVLEMNLWGAINGVQSFTPRMLEQGTPCAIINTGSKQHHLPAGRYRLQCQQSRHKGAD
jgi:NAD(P)-dependent dehydrogenase (short-subunit alcohol dehydrogenase family)